MKQTAVEYLFEQLWETPKDKLTWYSILEKAKQMENKQTAVKWLHIEFQKRFPKETNEMYNNNQFDYEDMIIKAKEMEKKQIMQAVYDSMGTNFDPNMGRAELYYNETFKNK